MSRALGIPTFEANKIGVRRVYTLGMIRGLGSDPDPDTITALIANGYDSGAVQTAVAMGATDEQLLALPYPDDPGTEAAAIAQLINQLGGAQAATGAPASSAASYPAAAQPTTVSSPFGVYDLSQEAAWNQIAALFTQVQGMLNQIAVQTPNDATLAANVQQFNSLVLQWAGYYQQAFGYAPSPLPLASQATTLSGLGFAPLVIIGLAAIVGAVLVGLYTIYEYAQTTLAKNAATASLQNVALSNSSTTANSMLSQAAALNSQASSLPAAQSAQAAALRAQATQLIQSATGITTGTLSATSPTAGTAALSTWFTQNWIGVAAVFLAALTLPPLVKKL